MKYLDTYLLLQISHLAYFCGCFCACSPGLRVQEPEISIKAARMEGDNYDLQNSYHKLKPAQTKKTHHINNIKKLHTLPTPQTYCFYKALKAQTTKMSYPHSNQASYSKSLIDERPIPSNLYIERNPLDGSCHRRLASTLDGK